ncbi:MAG: NitT/TauT family transport system ATP-binding protein [Chloroflexota bacterium]|jgi:NitT/TauT family transport system ATP-binding protein|nr:NitT/TauT family transport system ATP-binding protein [Chloroflexota bacterium]
MAIAQLIPGSAAAPMTTPKVEASHLTKWFTNPQAGHDIEVLRDVSVSVAPGEFLSIVGPSGCGKTTLLRIFAGLIPVSSGAVLYDGAPVSGPSSKMGFVFQSDNLLPWRRIHDNVAFGPELRGERRDSMEPRIQSLLRLVGLSGFERYYPHQLSGGMRQRVNLARALAIQPDVLLMDEPFAALDAQTREIMQDELLRIWQETGNTVIFITHQIDEAIFLADRIMVLGARPGRIREVIPVDLPRPRSLEMKRHPEFTRLADHVWSSIEQEVRESIRGEQEVVASAHQRALAHLDED